MSLINRLRVMRSGVVSAPGVDMGADPELIKLTTSAIVIKVPAHSYWRGIGLPRGTNKGEFRVYTINSRESNGVGCIDYNVTEVATFPVRGTDDQLLRRLTAEMDNKDLKYFNEEAYKK